MEEAVWGEGRYCLRCHRPEGCCWCGEEAELVTMEEYERLLEEEGEECWNVR